MKVLDILTAPWAITPDKKLEIDAIYATHLRGEKIDLKSVEAALGRPLNNQQPKGYDVENGVAIIGLDGVLAKRMNLFMQISGGTSYQFVSQQLRDALADSSVESIMLLVDSPGGSVDGAFELADEVFSARGQKPMVAVADGLMASAAYLIGSAADRVYVTSGSGVVGSIGVVQTHVDVSGAEAQRGIKTTEITSGKFKRIASSYAPLSLEGRQTLQEQTDYLYSLFLDVVVDHRGAQSAEAVHDTMADGRIFFGQQAVDVGLVDGVATIDDVLSMLARGEVTSAVPSGKRAAVSRSGVGAVPHAAGDAGGPETTHEEPHMSDSTKPLDVVPAAEVQAKIDQAVATATAGFDAKASEYRIEGAVAERERIQAVLENSMPGHEALVQQLAFDGKTTGPEAAVAVLKAEKEKVVGKGKDLRADAPAPAKTALVPDGEPGAEPAPEVDAQATAKKAQAYIAEQKKLGNTVSAVEAVAHVTKEG